MGHGKIIPKCYKCKVNMEEGLYIKQTCTGIGDFKDDEPPVTMSPGGSGILTKCWKCPVCGKSLTMCGTEKDWETYEKLKETEDG